MLLAVAAGRVIALAQISVFHGTTHVKELGAVSLETTVPLVGAYPEVESAAQLVL